MNTATIHTGAGTRVAGPVAVSPGTEQQYLTFSLGGEAFAIGILAIKEIIEYEPPTTVPMMPDYVRGVINLRGAAVPVIDLHCRLGRSPSQVTRRTCVVMVETWAQGQKQDLGVLVDAVNAVVDIPDEAIEPPPRTWSGSELLRGIGKVQGRFVMLLNIEQVLSDAPPGELAGLTALNAVTHAETPNA